MGCSSSSNNDKKLVVAVAASGQFAFKELAEEFSEEYKIEVDVITGSSGKLTTQILNGAPYDVFVSANMYYTEVLEQSQKTYQSPFVYSYGVPLIWTMNPQLKLNSIANCLKSSRVQRIAIANPQNAPYGEMAISYMKQLGIYEAIEKKLVFGESISQVNEYTLNKTVDVGITSKSVISSPKLKGKGYYVELDETFYIEQGMALIDNGTSNDIKKQFKEFVQSEKGKKILKSFGYVEK